MRSKRLEVKSGGVDNIMKIYKEFISEKNIGYQNRIVFLDFLKALAAYLTVFYHLAYYRLDYGFESGVFYIPTLNRIVMCFASCCVPIFFMVNGTLMFGRKRSWKDIYLKAAKILVLILIWSFSGFPSWFFKTMIVLYILFPCFQYFYRENRKIYLAICGTFFIFPFLCNLITLFLKGLNVKQVWFIEVADLRTTGLFTMYSILYFLLGPLLLERKLSLKTGIVSGIVGWLLVVIECVVYTNINGVIYDGVNAAFPTMGALFLSIGCFTVAQYVDFSQCKKVVTILGNSALSIYIFHMAVINTSVKIASSFELNLFTALIGTVGVCCLSIIIGKILERIPIICWSVRI